ncbi:TPA: hypothetical protein L1L53_004553 [Escherichia coli]|nr:hypothetical protein [Escherichia coli]
MATKKYELTKEYFFHGEFWHQLDDNKGRFSARIEYSPYHGLILDYCISDSESPRTCEILYGVLNTGERCTLIGKFDFTQGNIHFDKGIIHTGRHGFPIMLFNDFYAPDSKIEYCDLSLHGLQEFIHPHGFFTQLKHLEHPIFIAKGNHWTLQLVNHVSFSVIGDDLLNIINCQNKAALENIIHQLKKTKELYPDAFFSIRKELVFYFRIKSSNDLGIEDHISKCWDISGLFSILLNKPTLPEEINIKFKGNGSKTPCLLTTGFEQRTIDLALREIKHQLLPINRKHINLGKIFCKWFKIAERYMPLTITYQYETGFRTLHQAHTDIILFATQLEAINKTIGGSKNEKYMKPINEYASLFLIQEIEMFFKKFNNKSIGENIATLRNELARVDRKKELMNILTIGDYVKIGNYLKTIVTSYLLSDLGINNIIIEKYQAQTIQE